MLAAGIIGLLTVSIASPSFAAEKQADTNVAVLFDGSGSMVQKTGGERKIDIAKKSVKSFAELLPKDTNLMLRVFGHAGNNKLSGKLSHAAQRKPFTAFIHMKGLCLTIH